MGHVEPRERPTCFICYYQFTPLLALPSGTDQQPFGKLAGAMLNSTTRGSRLRFEKVVRAVDTLRRPLNGKSAGIKIQVQVVWQRIGNELATEVLR